MGLLDNNKVQSTIIPASYKKPGFSILADSENFTIAEFSPSSQSVPNWATLAAVWNNVAVFDKVDTNGSHLYISTNGLDGDTTEVAFNSTNFPHLIEGSAISRVCIVGYNRRTSSGASHTYTDKNWRLVVFTTHGQIYHNYPSKNDAYDGTQTDADMVKFDESVVWDLPNRWFPVKTESGDDATLIATGVYKYMPCYPDSVYEMHPGINVSNGYGNTGFGAVKTYTDQNGNTVKRPRFFVPVRNFYAGESFHWLNGLMQGSQYTIIGTYNSNNTGDYAARMCVFATNDGREWFVQYEYGANSELLSLAANGDDVFIGRAMNNSVEYFGEESRLKWGTNSMTDASAFVLKKRSSYTPSEANKEPEKIKKFKYGDAVGITSIVSSSDGIVITTSAAHGLTAGDDYIIESTGGNAAWDWLTTKNHTAMSAGNGVLWKAIVLSTTQIRLMMEIKNPDNNLCIRHIHAISPCKDGYVISCGEPYPNGWIELVHIPETDNFNNLYAGNLWPVIRLTSVPSSVQRALGFVFTQEKDSNGDNIFYVGSDHYGISTGNVSMPSGRTDTFERNSTGVFTGALSQIDSLSDCKCIYDTDEPCYHFSETCGILIFCGMRSTLALSKDKGKSWTTFRLPERMYGFSWLVGVTDKREICIKSYSQRTYGSTMIIRVKS